MPQKLNFCVFNRNEATTKVTAQAATTEASTPRTEPLGVISKTAKIEPGDAGETRPAWKTVRVNTPVIPPAIIARISLGFISTYGK